MQESGTPFSASSTEGAVQRQQENLEGSCSSTERMGKLRGWSGRLGEQFTSVLDTLSKGRSLSRREVHLHLQSATRSSPSLYPLHLQKQLHAVYALRVTKHSQVRDTLAAGLLGRTRTLISAGSLCPLPPEGVACYACTRQEQITVLVQTLCV